MAARQKTGGRRRGTPNKSKTAINEALSAAAMRMSAELSQEQIKAMMPLDVMLHAMAVHAAQGLWAAAAALAKEAAPYLHAKRAPVSNDDASDDGTIVIKGGLPDSNGD